MDGPVIADERWDRLIAEHRVAHAHAEAAGVAKARLSALSRFLYGLFGGCAAGLGLALLAISVAGLRSAYLYRERTGEGVGFFQQIFYGLPGALLCIVAMVCLLNASRGASRAATMLLRSSAVLLGVAVLAAWCAAAWVESQSGCISTCG